MMGGLADGELLERVPEGKQGAFGRLGDNVNQTSDRLLETVENIRDASNTISSSVKELRHGNNSLSASTEGQAASLEETASTMEEFTDMVKNNARSAQKANSLATSARSLLVKLFQKLQLPVRNSRMVLSKSIKRFLIWIAQSSRMQHSQNKYQRLVRL